MWTSYRSKKKVLILPGKPHLRRIKLHVKIHEDILAGNDPKSWAFSDEIVSVSYSKTEASGQPTFTLQDHDFKATGWKTMIAYDEIHTNRVLKQFFIISLFGKLVFECIFDFMKHRKKYIKNSLKLELNCVSGITG